MRFLFLALSAALTLIPLDPALAASKVKGDIDGDGRADLFWHNSATYENFVWFMNGANVSSVLWLRPTGQPNWWTDYRLVGVGDFNGDGKADVLWHGATGGANMIWTTNLIPNWWMQGYNAPQVPVPWTFAAVGDFNGDGSSEIVWRNTVSGENVLWSVTISASYPYFKVSALTLPPVPDPDWQIAGAGDLNGDGTEDLVWRNPVVGTNAVWLMNGTATPVTAALPKVLDTAWVIAGIGDIDGDGKADIVWRNPTTGDNEAWLMNGATMTTAGSLPPVYGSDWTIVRISDFDGDGKADIVWRNSATEDNAIWFLDGINVKSSATLPRIARRPGDPVDSWKVGGQP